MSDVKLVKMDKNLCKIVPTSTRSYIQCIKEQTKCIKSGYFYTNPKELVKKKK